MTEIAAIEINAFLTTSIAFLVFLIGAELTRKSAVLRDFNIPEPVSGGLVTALMTMVIYVLWGRAVEFDLTARDYFLVMFFTGIGLNAQLSDLARGGKPLVILLLLTVLIILAQNGIGLVIAQFFDLPSEFSVILGSGALIGGHGTVIAWGPRVGEATGLAGVEELGIAVATLGLVAAALIGGPVAKFLINRHDLTPRQPEAELAVGVPYEDQASETITHISLMRTILWMHVAMVLGVSALEGFQAIGLDLPVFVPCLL
ncbi:MAG: sodium/glutamate symporter, partial [Mangrovicoccus sp.]|nr:sodium/glutamate symporter [Mangrovicoccus sp.]